MDGSDRNMTFIVVNGPENQKIAKKYGIEGYPSLIYAKPKSNGLAAVEFMDDDNRTYTEVKKWLGIQMEKTNVEIEDNHHHETVKEEMHENDKDFEGGNHTESGSLEGQLTNL
jgi:hypothetical protein